jgi:hypothetical protein
MMNRAARGSGSHERRRWPTLSIVVAGAAVFIALSGSAVAANSLIRSNDIAKGAVTSTAIRNGAVRSWDLDKDTRTSLQGKNGTPGDAGANGATGNTGSTGNTGATGLAGTPGTDGIVMPLSTTAGLTALPTATPPTVVVNMAVPADNYVVIAKTQLSHSGAGDSVSCVLKAGNATIDQVSMKTLPALAAIPVSLQAVTTTSPSQLSVECDVLTADGSANFTSLIAIPIG